MNTLYDVLLSVHDAVPAIPPQANETWLALVGGPGRWFVAPGWNLRNGAASAHLERDPWPEETQKVKKAKDATGPGQDAWGLALVLKFLRC